MQSTNQGGIISVRTSDASYKTVSSGGGHIHSAVQQSMVYHHDYNRANTWNHITLPVSSPTGKTTSFTSIHQEIAQELSNPQWTAEITSAPRRAPGPGGPAIGEDKPGSPVGDMLLPMLMIGWAMLLLNYSVTVKLLKPYEKASVYIHNDCNSPLRAGATTR